MKVLSWLGVLGLGLFAGAGCDSNPTPHPQADATYDTRADTVQPSAEGPDDNNDGVPDCAAAGGYWDGDSCSDGLMTPDAASDTSAPAPDVGDAGDGELGPEDDADPGVDAGDGAEAGDGESASDSGPDATD